MRLAADITSPRLLAMKGLLFLFTTLTASAAVILLALQHGDWRLLAAAHAVALWSASRTYYFAFYVLMHYAGRGPYAGLFAAARATWAILRHH